MLERPKFYIKADMAKEVKRSQNDKIKTKNKRGWVGVGGME